MKSTKDQLHKPSRESTPWALWHWNLPLTKRTILEQCEWFVKNGFGGIIIRPSRDMNPSYLSDEFFNLFKSVLENADRNKIGIRIGDDFSLPWSGCFQSATSRNPQMRLQHLRLIENRLVSDRQEIVDKTANFDNRIVVAIKEVNGIPDPSTINEIQNGSGKNNHRWVVPDGTWRIMIFAKEYTMDPLGIHLPNVFCHACSDWYIHQVLEMYRERFSGFIPAIFEGFVCELPSTLPNSNSIPWDDDLVVKFRSKSKKNLIKLLPSLYCDTFPGAQKNRQQIYSFFHESVYERFVLPLEEWAKKNQLSQWVLCPERSDGKTAEALTDGYIPTGNGLSAVGFQNTDGVAQNYVLLRSMADINTNQCRRETITVLGRNRTGNGATLQMLKNDIDQMLLAGTSRMIIDGFFANLDQRSYYKTPVSPGWYAPEGSFIKDLCNYITRSNDYLKDVQWNRQIAVLIPTSEIMASYVPAMENISTVAFDRLEKTIGILERDGFSYDIITENFLSECSVRSNGEFGTSDRIRKGAYQALIIPYAPALSRNVLIFIEKLVQKEGCVLFVEEVPRGTIEDGVSPTMTTRFDKILADRHKATGVMSLENPEDTLEVIVPTVSIIQNGKSFTELAVAQGVKGGCDIYLFRNNSDLKDHSVVVKLVDKPLFTVVDCEKLASWEMVPEERDSDSARLQFVLSPHATLLLRGGSEKVSLDGNGIKAGACNSPSIILERTYRILLKDQWAFTTTSLNAFPLSTWNVRIGLSRESGGFSHFYESHFQIRSLPSVCQLLVGLSGFMHDISVLPIVEVPIEVTVNGMKVDKTVVTSEIVEQKDTAISSHCKGNGSVESGVFSATNPTSLVYPIKDLLLRGVNRISIRTTGLVSDLKTICYPPVLFGDFLVTKGQNGGVIDKLTDVSAQNSWTKNGFPYLCGKGIYRQSFELPEGYKKLVLCFPNVSGTIEVAMNGKDLGRYDWQPMNVDITAACEQKRNDLTVSVVNSVDTLLRMNGRPSGITGDVYLDVY